RSSDLHAPTMQIVRRSMVAPMAIISELRKPVSRNEPRPGGSSARRPSVLSLKNVVKNSVRSRSPAPCQKISGGGAACAAAPLVTSVALGLVAVDVEVEILLGDLGIGAIIANILDAGVDLVTQFGVTLAYTGSHTGPEHFYVRGDIALEVAAGHALVALQECVKRNRVRLRGVDTAGHEILVGLVLRLILLDFSGAVAEMLLGVGGMHGRNLYAENLALQALLR